MDICHEVKRLDLPSGEYIVIGSGILGALGIREVGDIDLLVTPRVFEMLRDRGWTYEVAEYDGRKRDKLSSGSAEAFKDFWYGDVNPDPARMIAEAIFIKDIPFLSLEKLLEIKRAFSREKDLADICLIEAYLKRG